jgi:hypothetical protein
MYAAAAMVLGVLLSGLVGVPLVNWLAPQPAWQDGRIFAENYDPVQTVPYFAGFVMLTGFLLFHITLYLLSDLDMKRFTLTALVFAVLYAALVFFNYIVQTTFVPQLARTYQPAFDPFIGIFTMTNPASLGWALEMWGYGHLGVASLLVIPFFLGSSSNLNRLIVLLLGVNGMMSVAGALITAFNLPWVFSAPGMTTFILWNIVMLVLGVALFAWFRMSAVNKILNVTPAQNPALST